MIDSAEAYGGRAMVHPEKGQKFGLWTFDRPGEGYNYEMVCDCGTVRSVRGQEIRSGRSASCGCTAPKELGGLKNRTHGTDYGSKTYRAWRNAKNRCFNPNSEKYAAYGGVGITMCPEWRHDYPAFAAEVGEPPTLKHSLDRKDNSKGYERGNVRWATPEEQCRNRQVTVRLTAFGETLPMIEWVNRYPINYATLQMRLSSGWETERALSQPVRAISKYKG